MPKSVQILTLGAIVVALVAAFFAGDRIGDGRARAQIAAALGGTYTGTLIDPGNAFRPSSDERAAFAVLGGRPISIGYPSTNVKPIDCARLSDFMAWAYVEMDQNAGPFRYRAACMPLTSAALAGLVPDPVIVYSRGISQGRLAFMAASRIARAAHDPLLAARFDRIARAAQFLPLYAAIAQVRK